MDIELKKKNAKICTSDFWNRHHNKVVGKGLSLKIKKCKCFKN